MRSQAGCKMHLHCVFHLIEIVLLSKGHETEVKHIKRNKTELYKRCIKSKIQNILLALMCERVRVRVCVHVWNWFSAFPFKQDFFWQRVSTQLQVKENWAALDIVGGSRRDGPCLLTSPFVFTFIFHCEIGCKKRDDKFTAWAPAIASHAFNSTTKCFGKKRRGQKNNDNYFDSDSQTGTRALCPRLVALAKLCN